jgi:hypothetical protein
VTAEAERQAISDLWPEHFSHLPPATNRMGQPFIDAEHGVVCNCGDVLGWPEDAMAKLKAEQAEAAEAMASVPADHKYTDSSGTEWISTPENPHPDDPRYQSEPEVIEAEVVEHHYDASMDPSAMAGEDNPGATLAEYPAPPEEDAASDPADEAQAARYIDVHLPPVTDEQLGRAVSGAIEDTVDAVEEVLGPLHPLSDREFTLPEQPPVGSGNLPARRSDVVVAEDPISARITIIDPSLPYGPADVEHQLLDIAARIERGVHFQRYWEERAHNAKIEYELSSARALTHASGGDAATRKAQALLECEEEYREQQVCETMVKAIRETMHNLRSLQSGYQTVARSVSASMQNLPQRGA